MAAGLPDHKPGRLSMIEKMPEAQQQQLRVWMHDGITYAEIKKRALEDFGVSLGVSNLSKYYSKYQREIIGNPHTVQAPVEPLHVRLVLHVQIRTEVIPFDVASSK